MTDFSIDWLDHSRVTAPAAHAACGGSGHLKTAKTLGIAVPQSLQVAADELIE